LAERAIKYTPTLVNERLYQGEILGRIVQVRQSLNSIGSPTPQIEELVHPFAIILAQDCDLEQDFEARVSGHGKLDNVLFCPAVATAALKAVASTSTNHWKLITGNRDIRYQCIEAVPADQDSAAVGAPSLGCDFKTCFTIPTDEVYKRIHNHDAVRRCRLRTPYAEHVLQRFCQFLARIPLPQNHEVTL
jgi:hypothetical protein